MLPFEVGFFWGGGGGGVLGQMCCHNLLKDRKFSANIRDTVVFFSLKITTRDDLGFLFSESRDCGWLVTGLYDYYASTKERVPL
jgi:hypothetical protein